MQSNKYIFLLIFSLSTSVLSAQHFGDSQDKEEIKALIGANKEVTGFGNIDFRVGEMKGSQVLIIGGYGGVLINKNVMLGMAAYGHATSVAFEGVNPKTNEIKDLNLYGGYAGVLLGFKVAAKEIVHVSFPIVIGAGQLDVSDDNYFVDSNGDNDYTIESSTYFLFEPSALLEINISHHFRLGFGAGYRVTKGLNLYNVTDDDLSGFTGVISFQLGKF